MSSTTAKKKGRPALERRFSDSSSYESFPSGSTPSYPSTSAQTQRNGTGNVNGGDTEGGRGGEEEEETEEQTNSEPHLFTPASVYPIASSRSTTSTPAFLALHNSNKSVSMGHLPTPPPYSMLMSAGTSTSASTSTSTNTNSDVRSNANGIGGMGVGAGASHIWPPNGYVDSDEDEDAEEGMIYASRSGSNLVTSNPSAITSPSVGASTSTSSGTSHSSRPSLRNRIFGAFGSSPLSSSSTTSGRTRDGTRVITTAPGVHCAGETETETDEPSRQLPTALRVLPSSSSTSTSSTPRSLLSSFSFTSRAGLGSISRPTLRTKASSSALNTPPRPNSNLNPARIHNTTNTPTNPPHSSLTNISIPTNTLASASVPSNTFTHTNTNSENTPTSRTALLFVPARFLSILPAMVGAMYNLYHVFRPPVFDFEGCRSAYGGDGGGGIGCRRPPPERIDYFVAMLWAILTGYQCLALTTGLLARWRVYYPPPSTLVRLLALQGICWPTTHVTLTVLGGWGCAALGGYGHGLGGNGLGGGVGCGVGPAVVWALIGSTTCVSRSAQIWVTSNLWWERPGEVEVEPGGDKDAGESSSSLLPQSSPSTSTTKTEGTPTNAKKNNKTWGVRVSVGGGTWGNRRWDWGEVGRECMLPAGIVYFVWAWAEQVRRAGWGGGVGNY